MSLWGSPVPMADYFLFHGRGQGWHLDRACFDQWLRDQAERRGAWLLRPFTISSIAPRAEGWLVTIPGVGQIHARVVVDSAGRRSPLAVRLGSHRRKLDSLVALAVLAEPTSELGGLSLVEAVPDGWWYTASLPTGRAVITLMTDSDIVRCRSLAQPSEFLTSLRATKLVSMHILMPEHFSPISVFAAHSGCSAHAAGLGWVCVGDALMTFDTLTSSGISGALSDALAAIPAIVGQLRGDFSPSRTYAQRANRTFTRYLRERQHYYGLEPRWRERAFWSRRSSPIC